MRTAFGRSQHATNWMTIALLTVFVMGFGIFANSRAETQSANQANATAGQCQDITNPTFCPEVAELDSNLTNSLVEVRGS